MTDERPIYCTHCGGLLPQEGDFCEQCGKVIESHEDFSQPDTQIPADTQSPFDTQYPADTQNPFDPQPPAEPQQEEIFLPDPAIPPRLGRALGRAWDVHMQDIWGGVLMALIYFAVAMAISSIPFIGYFAMIALFVGIMAWADERRRGLQSNIGTMFNVGINRFMDALLLGLVFMGFSLLIIIPAFLTYIIFIFWIIAAAGDPVPSAMVDKDPYVIWTMFTVMWVLFAITIIACIVLGPILSSLQGLTSWAIARGKPFKESFLWAWGELKSTFSAGGRQDL